jgi:hypothetical protein
MSISFQCEHCGKKVEAPDNAGGKWGKCPGCHNRVYVPAQRLAEQADDELRLAPLNNEDERKQQEMFAETVRLRQDILSETSVPEDVAPAREQPAAGKPAKHPADKPVAMSDAELTTSIIGYLRQMADGELEEAERTAETIISGGSKAIRILERIAVSKTPEPELADIPQNVLSGLIKGLRGRLR